MADMNTIGILTSGGDAPGMNAVIRSVVRSAIFNGLNVKGVRKGFHGLMNSDFIDMGLRSVSGTLQRGGTILHSARSRSFREDAGVEQAKENCIKAGIDGLIVCGGDGSFRGARDLSLKGIPCIGIPGTIDNDIAATDYTIGFDTAVNTVVQTIDKLRDTSESHNRCSVVEVMGRNCGDIALNAAICCGAEIVLIPEIQYDLQKDIIGSIQDSIKVGKTHFIVIVAEGCINTDLGGRRFANSEHLADYIESMTGLESRATVIGHVQRGGSPTMRDRVVASQMGNFAVSLLKNGVGNRVVALTNGKIVDYDIYEALNMPKVINTELYEIFNEIT